MSGIPSTPIHNVPSVPPERRPVSTCVRALVRPGVQTIGAPESGDPGLALRSARVGGAGFGIVASDFDEWVPRRDPVGSRSALAIPPFVRL